MSSSEDNFAWDWENESVPLIASGSGGAPKFIAPNDKHSVNEGETAYVAFNVEGDPAPSVSWLKGFEDLAMKQQRYKMWTKGGEGENLVILGINQCKQEDDGEYKCLLKNAHGEEMFVFRFFVTVEGGMDFRATLLKRKKPAKKVQVIEPEWIETPIDVTVQEGKVDKVVFTARLSEKEKKGRWFLRNLKTQMDKMATEYGLEITKKDEQYDITHEGDVYTLTITNPTTENSGRYTLAIKLEKDSLTTNGYLEVHEKDPEFCFIKKLEPNAKGFTNRQVTFICMLNQSGGRVTWSKNGIPLQFNGDGKFEKADRETEFILTIRNCSVEDAGKYSCEICEFVKEGMPASCETDLLMEEYPHTFTSELRGQSVVENDECVFEIDVEAEDAQVDWFHNGKRIDINDPRFVMIVKGKKRRLVLKCAQLSDAGEICVKTNTQDSKCELKVACENEIVVGLPATLQVIEREKIEFEVVIKDPEAEVRFLINSVEFSDNHAQIIGMGKGHHKFLIQHARLDDEGMLTMETPSNRDDLMLHSKCKVTVLKGEEAPELGDCGPVVGIAHQDCNWSIPYTVDGEAQSPLEVIVVKDGRELVLGKDVIISMNDEKIDLSVINPTRDKSGTYTVILRNAQGEVRKDINVNILDKPGPPQGVKVNNIFRDNCLVHWTPPNDDGGCPISHYVIEAIDLSDNCAEWGVIGQSCSGQERKFHAQSLLEGHRYKFRVSAVNKLGQSVPCTMSGDGVLIRDPWDPPSPPGRPITLDWTPDSCDLSWSPSEHDGGAPITHYEIEMKEKKQQSWQPGLRLAFEDIERLSNGNLRSTCPGLIEGFLYTFRVKASNKGGPSLPSLPSEPEIMAKNRFVAAFFHPPGICDLTVKKGRPICFDINCGGEPSPRITWLRNGRPLISDNDTLKISEQRRGDVYTRSNSVLTIEKSDRGRDRGKYTIRLESSSGSSTEASGFVEVLDVPAAPRDFKVENVQADRVTFSWQPPLDDGGLGIKHYQIRMMDFETGEWLIMDDFNGLGGTVSGLKAGKCYEFEIVAINKAGESLPMKIADPVFTSDNVRKPEPPIDPRVIVSRHHEMLLRWTRPHTDGGSPITHFFIEKRQVPAGEWSPSVKVDPVRECEECNDNQLQSWVPKLQNGKTYEFRVSALNKMGMSDPSMSSPPRLCQVVDCAPVIDKSLGGSCLRRENRAINWRIFIEAPGELRISWTKDDDAIVDPRFRCFDEPQSGGEREGTLACLSLSRCKRSDAGRYRLSVENSLGSDALDIDLIVLDDLDVDECAMFKSADLNCPCRFGRPGCLHRQVSTVRQEVTMLLAAMAMSRDF